MRTATPGGEKLTSEGKVMALVAAEVGVRTIVKCLSDMALFCINWLEAASSCWPPVFSSLAGKRSVKFAYIAQIKNTVCNSLIETRTPKAVYHKRNRFESGKM